MRLRLSPVIGNRQGAALVEFAIILPVLVFLFFGTYEVTRLVRTQMKVANATQAYADVIAADTSGSLTTANLSDDCTGAGLVLTPFPAASFSAAVASLTSNDGTTWTQVWHDISTCGVTASISGVSLASGLPPTATGDALIVVTAKYAYTSPISYLLPASQTLSKTAFARPRINATLSCSNCAQN
jgi:Flp pilus assembly protein TadG